MLFTVPLSRLIPSKRNPRRVKPDREAHRRLVALIRSQGLLQPLVVRPCAEKPKHFLVIAGDRRLAALREIHRNNGDPRIACMLRKVDEETADAMSLGENFGREPMHPLDEAEAFANLARHDGKDAGAIASEFGVKEHYVRQRIKLATLANPIKTAYREGTIDTGMAEAFSAVPEERQLQVWKEVDGHPRHAEHVRNVIANDWIDIELAVFDRSVLPEAAVSQDLFGERVLVERQAFLDSQSKALLIEQTALTEDGWSEVVVGRREDVQDRLYAMDRLPKEFDGETTKALKKLEADRRKLEQVAEKIDENDEDRLTRLQERFDKIDERKQAVEAAGQTCFSEATKSRATIFLILDPDGQVDREYRLPSAKRNAAARGAQSPDENGHDGSIPTIQPLTSDDLSDRQLAITFTHQAVCVREALVNDVRRLKRVLALLLHEKVRLESLAMRHDANGTTLHATSGEGCTSAANTRLQTGRKNLDPFVEMQHLEECEAYDLLGRLSEKKINALIDLLTVELITGRLQRPTPLVAKLAAELKVNVRDDWTPAASWLGGFQKIQLSHLVRALMGDLHAPDPKRKKSELVEQLVTLFTEAAEGRLEDKALAASINAWLPANLREVQPK